MPGSMTLNAPSYRPALVGSRAQGDSLLAALSRQTRVEAAAPDRSDKGAQPGSANASRSVTGAERQVNRDIAQFTRALATANTPAQLLASPIALRVLLTAHGLADQADNTALATRVLLSNPARSNSLLKQLKDRRWFTVNHRYSFATKGLAQLREQKVVAAISRSYAAALLATGTTIGTMPLADC
jgi:uncharacterized protein DUF1217